MGAELKPVGQAVAIAKGHYPLRDGRSATIVPGQTFEIFEGLTKAKWFTVVKPGKAPAPAAAPEPVEPPPDTLSAVAAAERKRKAQVKPPTADDIA